MTDIDFDELDKAVASAMGRPGGDNPGQASHAEPASSPAVRPSGEHHSFAAPSRRIMSPAPPVAARQEPLMTKGPTSLHPEGENPTASMEPPINQASIPVARTNAPTGRFMDVMAPRSKPRAATSNLMASQQRTGMSSESVATPVVSEPDYVEPVVSKPVDDSLGSANLPGVASTVGRDDGVGASGLMAGGSSAEMLTASELAPSPAAAPASPFMNDVPVDKRPLGAFASDSKNSANPDVTESRPSEPTQQSDVEQLTSPGFGGSALPNESQVMATEPKQPAVESDQMVTRQLSSSFGTGSGGNLAESIPPQYSSPEPALDDEAHSIFDTNAYHQPLLTSGKRHMPAWAWLLLLLALLATGVGIGVAAFYVFS